MTIPITSVNKVYQTAGTARITREKFYHAGLHRFHTLSWQLSQELADAEDTPFWGELLRSVRKFRFRSSSTPLPFSHPYIWTPEADALMQRAVALAPHVYPAAAPLLKEARDLLPELLSIPENPLWASIQKRLVRHRGRKPALVLKDARALQPVLAFAGTTPLEIITAAQLQGPAVYPEVLVLGATWQFPDHCFTVPRAPQVHLLQYAWVKDRQTYKPAFTENQQEARYTRQVIQQTPHSSMIAPALPETAFELPGIDWAGAMRAAGLSQTGPGTREEDVPARLFALENGFGVLLEDAADAHVQTISFPAAGLAAVERTNVPELQDGMFILLRTQGGGDQIIPVADRILGQKEAKRLRGLQQEWKRAFRQAVLRRGDVASASRVLRAEGLKRATPGNIRNWMSMGNIRPDAESNYRQLLAFAGLEARHTELWEAMGKLESAHRSAGSRIRSALLNTVRQADMTPLRTTGVQLFELPVGDGGSFTAYRILGRSPDTAEVAPHRLCHVFRLEN